MVFVVERCSEAAGVTRRKRGALGLRRLPRFELGDGMV